MKLKRLAEKYRRTHSIDETKITEETVRKYNKLFGTNIKWEDLQ